MQYLIHMVALILAAGTPPGTVPAPPEEWKDLFRIETPVFEGIPCRKEPASESPEVRRLYFKQPFMMAEERNGWVRVKDEPACWLPPKTARRFHSRPVFCPAKRIDQPLVPLKALLKKPFEKGEVLPAGKLFPTFYIIAREEMYPLKPGERKVAVRDRKGKALARVSPLFKRSLMYQGTGRLMDGRVLNVGKVTKRWGRTFWVLPEDAIAFGIRGFEVYPYRSAAVDFDWLCDRLDGHNCRKATGDRRKDRGRTKENRDRLAGSLLFIPRLAGVEMWDGAVHDGYVCAVDVGGGIKKDRIDLFVGIDGGGNPYYPACRRHNPFLRAGIRSLVPWDWRSWHEKKPGVWKRAEREEYRTYAKDKGLEVFLVPGVTCRKRRK